MLGWSLQAIPCGLACSPLHAGPLAMCAAGVNPTDSVGDHPTPAKGPDSPVRRFRRLGTGHDAGRMPTMQVFDFMGNCQIVHTF